MSHKKIRLIALVMLILLMAAGCGKKAPEVNPEETVQMLLQKVTFDTELEQNTQNAELFFPGLPEGSKITLYAGSGYFADEVVLIQLPAKASVQDARRVVDSHLEQVRNQFMNYVPAEITKIDNAIIVENEDCILLCITNDYEHAEELLRNGAPADTVPTDKPQSDEEDTKTQIAPAESTAPDSEATTVSESTAAETTVPVEDYPVLTSKSGEYYDYGNYVIRVDDTAFEKYGYSDSSASAYAGLVNQAASAVKDQTKVYALPIPTAIGVVLPDDIAEKLEDHADQNKVIGLLDEKLSEDVITVNCFPNMMLHRDEYLYFHTDYHWNGRGAYYAYESFCRTKGVAPVTLDERIEKKFPDFLGFLYSASCNNDPILKENPDTVYAYLPKSENVAMQFTDNSGNTFDWNVITDVSSWDSGTKYNTFAAGDNPFAVFTNPDVTDGSVCVIVKESYGNALLPYLVDHYSTVYEIDYRYWEGDLVEFVKEKKADDLIFANNLTMIGSDLLIGRLANIIKT